jgi:2-keto-4-pentenoate hydratase
MRYAVAVVFLVSVAVCRAAPDQLSVMVENYFALRDVPQWTAASNYEQALRVQDAFVQSLIPKLGKPVGFKVGLVTREAQDRFNISHPVRGRLLPKMLLANDAQVPIQYGVRPVCEADLVVVVKDKDINDAQTLTEALHNLKEIVAFIELADSFVATNPPINAVALTAANVGARLGVMGERLPLKTTPEFLNALAQMRVTIRDDSGTDLGEGQGGAILSHPLNAVLWLVEDLKKSGQKLRPGDLISLGSIKAFTPSAGQRITVTYSGIPRGPIKASVRFQ